MIVVWEIRMKLIQKGRQRHIETQWQRQKDSERQRDRQSNTHRVSFR